MTSPLYAFEITLQSQPAEATAGPPLADAWGTWPTLDVPKELLASPMAIGFDAAFERLAAIERLYAEPDGSFVWTCSRTGDGAAPTWWQVDGTAYERGGRVLLVDLKGSCPPEAFDRLLSCFGWPQESLMMQLVRPGLFLEEAIFRQHALARGIAGDGETLRPR